MAQLLPDLVTPLSTEQIVAAVSDGYNEVMGARPMATCHAVLCAQVSLETGNGRKMHRFNPGNRKVRDGDEYYTMFACNEVIGGKVQWFSPPHPQTHFAAFLTPAAGVADYLKLLSCTDRYRAAWSRAYVGDARGFVEALGRAGYFTADPNVYARGIVAIAAKLLPLCGSNDPLSDEDRDHIGELVAVTLALDADEYRHAPERWAA